MTSPGQALRTLGVVNLPSGARYEVHEIATENASALQLRFISARGSRHDLVIYRSAAGRISELIQEWHLQPQAAGSLNDYSLGERARLKR